MGTEEAGYVSDCGMPGSDPMDRIVRDNGGCPGIVPPLDAKKIMRDPWLPTDIKNPGRNKNLDITEKDYDPMDNDLKSTNPKDIAATYRLDLTLFPSTAVAYGALGMTEGHCKYGAYNYRIKGIQASTYIAALKRHVEKYENGEWSDKKTRVPHLANILSCAAILVDGHELGIIKDDRPPRVNMSRILDGFMGIVKHLYTIFPNSPGRYTEAEHGKKEQA